MPTLCSQHSNRACRLNKTGGLLHRGFPVHKPVWKLSCSLLSKQISEKSLNRNPMARIHLQHNWQDPPHSSCKSALLPFFRWAWMCRKSEHLKKRRTITYWIPLSSNKSPSKVLPRQWNTCTYKTYVCLKLIKNPDSNIGRSYSCNKLVGATKFCTWRRKEHRERDLERGQPNTYPC